MTCEEFDKLKCFVEDNLARSNSSGLTLAETAALVAHFETCAACRKRIAEEGGELTPEETTRIDAIATREVTEACHDPACRHIIFKAMEKNT